MSKIERAKSLVERLLAENPDGLDWEQTRAHVARINGETERQANRTLANATDSLDLDGVACVDPRSNRIVRGTVYPSPEAPTLAAQIRKEFAGRHVTRRQIVQHYEVSYPSAARALSYTRQRDLAVSQRVGSVAGWLIKPLPDRTNRAQQQGSANLGDGAAP